LLRRALRHGVVPDGARTANDATACYFRVGSRTAFYGCASAMVASALAITVLGSAYELLHHRVGVVFVAIASAMLALFRVAAYGASETIPLDVVVDALGVTFAGGRTPWRAIRDVRLAQGRPDRPFVQIALEDRVLRLGPAPRDRASALARAVAAGIETWRERLRESKRAR
jgi:hypothetical protein